MTLVAFFLAGFVVWCGAAYLAASLWGWLDRDRWNYDTQLIISLSFFFWPFVLFCCAVWVMWCAGEWVSEWLTKHIPIAGRRH